MGSSDSHKPEPILERLFSLRGKVALVTGAAGGLGTVLARALAEAGAHVAVQDLETAPTKAVASSIEALGAEAVALSGDLGDVATCRRVVAEAARTWGRLDILLTCAAVNRRKPIVEVTEEDFDHISAINTKAVYFLSQATQPHLKRQGGGKIIHIGSINPFYALDNVSVYGLSKGAVVQMTRAMAVEWAADNIQVNCIAPGFLRTPLSQPLWNDATTSRWLRSRIPQRRPGEPDELIGTTLLLASGASSYLTGQTIIIDGGFDSGGSWQRDPEFG